MGSFWLHYAVPYYHTILYHTRMYYTMVIPRDPGLGDPSVHVVLEDLGVLQPGISQVSIWRNWFLSDSQQLSDLQAAPPRELQSMLRLPGLYKVRTQHFTLGLCFRLLLKASSRRSMAFWAYQESDRGSQVRKPSQSA